MLLLLPSSALWPHALCLLHHQIKEATAYIKNLADTTSVTTEMLDAKLRQLDAAERMVRACCACSISWLTVPFRLQARIDDAAASSPAAVRAVPAAPKQQQQQRARA